MTTPDDDDDDDGLKDYEIAELRQELWQAKRERDIAIALAARLATIIKACHTISPN